MTPEDIERRRQAYRTILGFGLLAIRAAACRSDAELCEIEADHLHNIPSLLDETNEARHIYYAQAEREMYLDRVRGRADRNYLSSTVDRYEAPWAVLTALAGRGRDRLGTPNEPDEFADS